MEAKKRRKLGVARRTHGGGAWKSFVSEQGAGKGRLNALELRRIGRRYRELPPEERVRLRERGQLATLAWRYSLSRVYFQPVDAGSRRTDAVDALGGERPSGADLALLPSLELPSLRSALASATLEHAEAAKIAREKSDKAVEIMRLLQERPSSGSAPVDLGLPSEPKVFVDEVVSSSLRVSTLAFAAPAVTMARAVMLRMAGPASNALIAAWEQRFRMYRQCDTVPIRKPKSPETLCQVAGICFHTPEGIRLAKFEIAFVKVAQLSFPAKSKQRLALGQSNICFCLTGGGERWFHIAYTTFSAGAKRPLALALDR